ncbi:MAG: HD domain-containing protein [Ferruginibacter sp.]|nr:HD domain-containing protein [Cytophagales bacterium]
MFFETDLLRKTREHAESLLSERTTGRFPYHNLDHTREVVEAANEIGKRSGLDKKDLETVLIAAWMHDTGYCNQVTEHEEAGAELARDFLQQNGSGPHRIEKVVHCIRATKMPQQPEGLLAEVLCDADLYHLATAEYPRKTEMMRQEFATVKSQPISEEEWEEINVRFLRDHVYFTAYGKTELQPRQDKNLRKLEKKIRQRRASTELPSGAAEELVKENQKLKAKLEKEKNKLGRGVETMFRTTSTNHYQLSDMADNKANIMISINAIMVSLIVSVMIRKFEEFPNLILPTAILTTVCLLTIVFAVLATRPRFTSGVFTREDIHNRKANLLFFGNFHRMNLEDYEWGMLEIMKDSNLLYTSMIHDIYFLGKVLGRKYSLLRISYTIFMYGFVFSVLCYAVALTFFPVY